MYIKCAGIVPDSIVDGPGMRVTVFFQGCRHKCKRCHNPETWSFQGGYDASIEGIFKDIQKSKIASGVTLSGGDPLYQAEGATELAKMCKDAGYNVWCYTGFYWEDVHKLKIMRYIDVLVDGPFIVEKKTFDVPFVGSSNQRKIDVQTSLKTGDICLVSDDNLFS